ncbi:MAG TPA: HPF/RaiA family ribosome-associated protein [Methylotenera sp.]|nr:HPF/RaiA family ribosome-associated protein [Methylotenera sp.]HPV44152.1 HPF/RaiA family ribosome-associated protein [Methylotenera sp.]
MQFKIQTNGFALTDSLRSYTTRRMQFALDRNDGHIMSARVRLSDINGPRGGVDKCCQIDLALAGQNNIVIEDTEADLYVAIDRASDRCKRTLARRLERLREHSHDPAFL